MTYPALPDRRMPYHRDGSVIAYGASSNDGLSFRFAQGISAYLSGADRIELNDGDYAALSVSLSCTAGNDYRAIWVFFPEQREVSAIHCGFDPTNLVVNDTTVGLVQVDGSNDTTNGVDGAWETASLPAGRGHSNTSLDGWRANIKAVSFTGGKRAIRFGMRSIGGSTLTLRLLHLYGEKVAGQTPDDLIFIDHDTTPGAEYTAPEDFGDRPLGTTVTRQFRVKNASATLTATSINLQCNDSDFAISTDGTTWVTTINIASLAAGAESATMYIRDTTPAPGNLLGPRFAEIVAIVGSWT